MSEPLDQTEERASYEAEIARLEELCSRYRSALEVIAEKTIDIEIHDIAEGAIID